MSIADGQLVLTAESRPTQTASASSQQQPASSSEDSQTSQQASSQTWPGFTGNNVDVSASVSRIGCRAYPPAMAILAPSIRFDLAQAIDAERFGTDRAESGVQHQQLQRAALLRAALAQRSRHPVPLEEQVMMERVWLIHLFIIMQLVISAMLRCSQVSFVSCTYVWTWMQQCGLLLVGLDLKLISGCRWPSCMLCKRVTLTRSLLRQCSRQSQRQ